MNVTIRGHYYPKSKTVVDVSKTIGFDCFFAPSLEKPNCDTCYIFEGKLLVTKQNKIALMIVNYFEKGE